MLTKDWFADALSTQQSTNINACYYCWKSIYSLIHKQKVMIYWFTGQPGHGKTVLATALKQELDNTFHIDGDDLRAIFDNKDYSEAGRRKNIELAQHLAHFLHNKKCNVVVSLVSPYKDQREDFKNKLGESIKEFYIHTTEIRGRKIFMLKTINNQQKIILM
jgi:adenylylsulfate kinase-like enzyme